MTHSSETIAASEILSRAQGCMLGQFAGEMLGMPVEIMGPLKTSDATIP